MYLRCIFYSNVYISTFHWIDSAVLIYLACFFNSQDIFKARHLSLYSSICSWQNVASVPARNAVKTVFFRHPLSWSISFLQIICMQIGKVETINISPLNSQMFCLFSYGVKQRLQKVWLLARNYPTRHSCPILMKLQFFGQIFEIFSSIKFRENPLIGSRFFSIRADRRIEVTKLIVAFVSFAKGVIKITVVMVTGVREQSLVATCCVLREYLRQWTAPNVPVKFDILSCCSQYGIEDAPGILCNWKFFSHLPLRTDWQGVGYYLLCSEQRASQLFVMMLTAIVFMY
jgi:hypothetical protein